MERLVLTATVESTGDGYLALLGPLKLQGEGETARMAQDDLVDLVRSWIELRQADESLGQALTDAGFPGLEDDTEICLEFIN